MQNLKIWKKYSQKTKKKSKKQTHLRSSTFTDCDYPILVKVKTHPNLTHRLWISTEVGKFPSHSNLPNKPFHWLCLLAVFGKHQGIKSAICPVDSSTCIKTRLSRIRNNKSNYEENLLLLFRKFYEENLNICKNPLARG